MKSFSRFGVLMIIVTLLTFGFMPVAQAALCVPVTGGLSWAEHPETDVTKFHIYQSDVSPTDLATKVGSPPMASVADSPLNMVEGRMTYKFKTADLVDGKSYFFAVTAIDQAGNESGLSNVATCNVSLAPQPPTNLQLE